MKTRRWTRLLLPSILAASLPSALVAQGVRVVPTRVSTVAPRWLGNPVESSSGRFVATTSDSAIYVFDRDLKRWDSLAGPVSSPHWSPNGRFLAFSRREQAGFRIWILPFDPKTGKASGAERRVTIREGRFFNWSPDGGQIVFLNPDSGFQKVWIQPFNGGDERLVARVAGGSGSDPAWAPDGKAIYFAAGHGAGYIARLTLASSKVDSVCPMRDLIGISADGRFIAQNSFRVSTVVISSASNGREVKRLYLPPGLRGISWSSRVAGELIALDHPMHQEIHSVSLSDGSIHRLISGDSMRVGGPQLSPDGSQLLFTSGTRLMLSRPDGSGARVVKTAVDIRPLSGIWSPDGARILYRSVDPEELHVVDARTLTDTRIAQVQEAFPLAGGLIRAVWRADGRAVRYSRMDHGARGPSYNVHEVGLSGRDTILAAIPDTIGGRNFDFLNDTLFLAMRRDGIAGLSLNTGRWTTLAKGNAEAMAISHDGSRLAYGFWPGQTDDAVLHVVENGSTRTINNPLGGEVQQIYFLPDGKNVVAAVCATCGTGSERRQLVLFPLNGDPPRVLSGKAGTIMDWDVLAVTRDGRTLIYDPELAWPSAVVHIPIDLDSRP